MNNFSASTLELQMEFFEGPLAVLITLIKRNKIDIFDIPIGWITEQFLEYVELAREMNLRTAEDFIEMASLLIFIKSRMLLPTDGEDPREELVEKIIEYEKIRTMAKSLDRLSRARQGRLRARARRERRRGRRRALPVHALFAVDKEQAGALHLDQRDTADPRRKARRDQERA